MRYAIYRRVSTRKQATTGASLDDQLAACRAYAEARGWTMVADYVEAGRSAYRDDLSRRPQFQALRAAAAERAFDVVLVYELSRFGRRRKAFAVGEDLERLGIRLVSVTEQFDTETIEGFVTYSILAMQAELHSRLLSRRMQAVRAGERERGITAQVAPLGMRWGETGLEIADPALVRRAYDLALSGHGTKTIAAALAAEGHGLSLSSLHYILTNPTYAGLLRHEGRLVPAAWPAIIPREEWERVQQLRAARSPRERVRATVRTTAHSLLAGLLFCANCGAKLHYCHHAATHPEKRNYYRCSCRENGGHCDARPSRADTLDEQVAAVVGQLALTPEVIARARDLVVSQAAAASAPSLGADPAALRERLRRLGVAFADGAMDDGEYQRRRAGLLAQLEAAVRPPDAPTVDVEAALDLVARLPVLWGEATNEERRGILGALVSQIYARRHTIYALRPTRLADPVLRAALLPCSVTPNPSSPCMLARSTAPRCASARCSATPCAATAPR